MGAVRTGAAPDIDGELNDEAWKTASVATDFAELRPVPGKIEDKSRRTEVRILYDNSAIYVGARMFEHPDSISREIVTRDQVGNSDFIGIIFDTYLDRINGIGFFVTAANSQFDAKYSQTGNEDPNWNAVWDSDVKIDKHGWTAEMRIPYSALRFGSRSQQTWGLNMTRRRQRINQQSFWNFVDPKVNGFINQEGELTEIKDIKSPVRLSVSPYVSSYVNHYPYNQSGIKNTSGSFNGGMDLKYGISQGFTLDMTLVPDFGQVQSDNQVLNLSPFEIRFDENRQFFTEGTELFNKGDLFYSRRIGSFPAYVKNAGDELQNGETIKKNPQESKLINATKVSGRTPRGLGIGVFNAITNPMNAVVATSSGAERLIQTQPLTNYNILVLDQSLKNNSSVTLLNTNVFRQGDVYDANVSAFLFSLNTKNNTYNLNGAAKMSHIGAGKYGAESSNGFNYEIEGGRQSGNFIWSYGHVLSNNRFDPTDMGFFTNNNFFDHSASAGYNIFKPGKWYNEIQTWLEADYSMRYIPRSYQTLDLDIGTFIRLKNFWSVEAGIGKQWAGNDFYEARNAGRVYKTPANKGFSIYVNSNRAKRFRGGAFIEYAEVDLFNGKRLGYGSYQNFQLSNKFNINTEFSIQPERNAAGWAGTGPANEIVFSRFNRNTVESLLNIRYTFSARMGITLRGRHYWSDRRNAAFYSLLDNGDLQPADDLGGAIANRNYNIFNIDMIYFWQFAPGSELTVAYKDAAQQEESRIRRGYFQNVDRILGSPQNNSLSLKVLYYLDYLQFRKKG